MSKIRVGIDPGKEGCIIWFEDGELSGKEMVPLVGREVDTRKLDKIYKELVAKSDDLFVVMEATNPFFGASSKTMYKFGHTVACLEMGIVSNKIPFTKVQPKKWQDEMLEGVPKQYVTQKYKSGKKKGQTYKKHDTKATALLAAKRLFPDADLTQSERAYTPHEGVVDALLIAEYCRRNF